MVAFTTPPLWLFQMARAFNPPTNSDPDYNPPERCERLRHPVHYEQTVRGGGDKCGGVHYDQTVRGGVVVHATAGFHNPGVDVG